MVDVSILLVIRIYPEKTRSPVFSRQEKSNKNDIGHALQAYRSTGYKRRRDRFECINKNLAPIAVSVSVSLANASGAAIRTGSVDVEMKVTRSSGHCGTTPWPRAGDALAAPLSDKNRRFSQHKAPSL
jgi:hypothetical protein